jgi:hypothetical protein
MFHPLKGFSTQSKRKVFCFERSSPQAKAERALAPGDPETATDRAYYAVKNTD